MVGWNLFPFPTVRIINSQVLNARVKASQQNIPALQGCTSDTDRLRDAQSRSLFTSQDKTVKL